MEQTKKTALICFWICIALMVFSLICNFVQSYIPFIDSIVFYGGAITYFVNCNKYYKEKAPFKLGIILFSISFLLCMICSFISAQSAMLPYFVLFFSHCIIDSIPFIKLKQYYKGTNKKIATAALLTAIAPFLYFFTNIILASLIRPSRFYITIVISAFCLLYYGIYAWFYYTFFKHNKLTIIK